MPSSADVALLFSMAELARRFGMKPSEAETFLDFVTDENGADGHFRMQIAGGTLAKKANLDRMMQALGCASDGVLIAERIGELEDIVERAMSIAPRPRSI